MLSANSSARFLWVLNADKNSCCAGAGGFFPGNMLGAAVHSNWCAYCGMVPATRRPLPFMLAHGEGSIRSFIKHA